MGWLGVKWAYRTESERLGPFSTKEIKDLIKKGSITPETRLCEYKEKTDYQAIKTEFSVCFPHKDFIAATKDAQVSDYFMWIGVFCPIVFFAVLYYVYFMGREVVIGGPVVAYIGAFFMGADCVVMIKKGYKPPMRTILYSIFFAPMIYFYYRSKQLRRRQTSTWMSAACLLTDYQHQRRVAFS